MISRRDEEGFSSCSVCPCHRAVASTPPKCWSRIDQVSAPHAAFALRLGARPSGPLIFEATFAFHCCYGPVNRRLPPGDVVDRLQSLGFPPPCYPNYGVLIFAPAGLSPAEQCQPSLDTQPDVQISRIRLSDKTSRHHSRATPSAASEHHVEVPASNLHVLRHVLRLS